MLIKCAIGSRNGNPASAAQCGGKTGQSLPEECSPPGKADDCAIIVSLSEKTTLGKAHNLCSFILCSLLQLFSRPVILNLGVPHPTGVTIYKKDIQNEINVSVAVIAVFVRVEELLLGQNINKKDFQAQPKNLTVGSGENKGKMTESIILLMFHCS